MPGNRYHNREGGFSVLVPPGWTAEADPQEGGSELFDPDGAGSLHLLGFPAPADEPLDPAEELFAFLDEEGIELDEEDVDDLPLEAPAAMAVCEYITEPENGGTDEENTFWLVGVATAPERLVFAIYSCPAGEEAEEREKVHSVFASLQLEKSG